MRTAALVRLRKEQHPELYCPKCQWMTGGGACPRHGGPEWTQERQREALLKSRGETRYRLHTVDGEVVLVTAKEFFDDNAADAELRAAILALRVGESFQDGGGASPEWSIERVR